MEEASRATGVTAPTEAGFEVEMVRVAIAGIKVRAGAATRLSVMAKSKAGQAQRRGQFYSVDRENALSRASRGGRGGCKKQGGEIGGDGG